MEAKEKSTKVLICMLALGGLLLVWTLATAGDLEPSGPPGPTMKTLDEVEPRAPIHAADLPLTITTPGSYYFVEDIDFMSTSNHAITVECNDVTIDLMGYTLTGPDSTSNHGIYVYGCTNVEIRNGTIRDFYCGIREGGSVDCRCLQVINIRALSNVNGMCLNGYGHLIKDCTTAENWQGIVSANRSIVTGNICHRNGGEGIHAGLDSTVTGNICSENGSDGIYVGDGCTVTGNTCYGNDGRGVVANYNSTVAGNTVCDNNSIGIQIIWSGSSVTGNTVYRNKEDGIQVSTNCTVADNTCDENGYQAGDGAGIHATGENNRILRNYVNDNDRGIDVDGANNLIVKNSAASNTTEYDIVGGNKVGTISADPTTAGPWDNFDF